MTGRASICHKEFRLALVQADEKKCESLHKNRAELSGDLTDMIPLLQAEQVDEVVTEADLETRQRTLGQVLTGSSNSSREYAFLVRCLRVPAISRPGLIVFFILATLCPALIAQNQNPPLSVAEAKDSAARLGSSQVSVRGHIWVGKEGSMIYDNRYKAILRLQFSDAFNAKHSFYDLLSKARQFDLATITGRLGLDSNGRIVLIADDVQFIEKPK